jgi:CheY-like chemotaxis protein
LPVPEKGSKVTREDPNHAGGAGPLILVIEEEPAIRDLLAVALPAYGFRVLAARGGAVAGVELFRRHAPDIALVLCDVRMAGPGGLDVLEALKGIDPHVQLCFMTGGGPHTNAQLRAAGALHIFAKPFCLAELASRLQELTGRADAPLPEPRPRHHPDRTQARR